MTQALARFLVAASAILALSCHSFGSDVPARGSVLGREIVTRVDSRLAAQYLEHFDAALGSPELRPRPLSDLPACAAPEPGGPVLRDIAERYSLDVASLHAAGCLVAANRDIAADFQARLDELARAEREVHESAARQLAGLTILLVPGWDYEKSGEETGADFAQQRELLARLGVRHALAPIDPTGSVEENAQVIRQELERLCATGESIMIVSASSGGPPVALALGTPAGGSDLRAVRGWLNIGGVLGGVPLIDAHSQGARRLLLAGFVALKGWRMEAVQSMLVERSRERLAGLKLPDHVVVINYVAIPLAGDISSRAAFFHRSMRPLGPNDGLTMITDPILPGTRTIVALGQDHFFADDPELAAKTVALASVMARAMRGEEQPGSIQLASHPAISDPLRPGSAGCTPSPGGSASRRSR